VKEAIAAAVSGQEVAAPLMEAAMSSMFSGEASPAQMAALLIALRIKGETAQEIATAATVMRRYCVRVELAPKPVVLDTCGTGGDGSQTFNISTAAALVIAACGVPLAKHGNRAATSRTGSADVLEVLGIQIELSPERVARCIEEVGIGFMFARTHHPAMRHVGPVRAELGVRTLFNFLGPLTNPASATHQLIGVPEPRLLGMMVGALAALGAQRAWVVHGDARLDELALTGPTRVAQLDGGVISEFVVTPEDFGLSTQPGADLRVRDARESAELIRAVLGGQRGAARDVVILNAAAGLVVAGRAAAFEAAARVAAEAIDSGAALETLAAWALATQAD
jgi:anthranilate phosphoribosyltransferase